MSPGSRPAALPLPIHSGFRNHVEGLAELYFQGAAFQVELDSTKLREPSLLGWGLLPEQVAVSVSQFQEHDALVEVLLVRSRGEPATDPLQDLHVEYQAVQFLGEPFCQDLLPYVWLGDIFCLKPVQW